MSLVDQSANGVIGYDVKTDDDEMLREEVEWETGRDVK